MKVILATALILVLGVTGFSLWSEFHAQRMAVSSSQIFIHGTPVCVMRQDEDIIASVGMCGSDGGELRQDDLGNEGIFHGETPSPLEPSPGLPPGHPPVDSTPSFEEGRRIPI